MIESVDRIVSTPVSECPSLIEAAVVSNTSALVRTFWVQVEHTDKGYKVTEVDTGAYAFLPADAMVTWLIPEDMNSPAIQAELIVALAQMGMEL